MADTFVASVVGKVVDLLFGVAIKSISYIWNCSKNVETCKDEVKNLTAMEQTLQDRINDAALKAEAPGKDMKSWIKEAGIQIREAQKFIDEEAKSKTTCCNLGTLYSYGKKATKISSSLVMHQQGGEPFRNCNFRPLPTPRMTDLYQRVNLENIDTHKSTLKNIICAIENEDIQIVGITGLGGVGKTTLACEVAAEMRNKFDHIEFVEVSVSNKINQKVEIASKKVMDQKKVLIILDDVWEELKPGEVGIPCGSDYMKCKILVTSRKDDVCRDMNAQKIYTVTPLQEEEALTLFKRAVGVSKWDKKLEDVGLKIVQECGGLPLFVQVLGKTLKNKEFYSFETVLHQLQAPIVGDDICKKEFQILKLSYDYLEDEVAKKCFLLCSMFPADRTIGLKRLTHYGLALQIFNNLDNIQDAIFKVRLAIESLTSSFLLRPVERFNLHRVSHEGEEEEFKMHDLVRDMALSITCKLGNDDSWVRSGFGWRDWQPKTSHSLYKKISLIGNRIQELPDHDLLFPNLDTFLIQDNDLSFVPHEFFRGMEKLKVLDMSRNKVSSLPRSLKLLTLLHTLYLSENESLCEIYILGELTCLEILKLRGTGITNIPHEIGKLTNLRLLDVDYCGRLSYVTPGVISNLIWLEELYIGMGKGDCDFVKELSKLKSLKVVHLKVPSLSNFPKDFNFETLTEFHIKDNIVWLNQTRDCKRILEISQRTIPLTMPIIKLIEASEMLNLWNINDFDDIFAFRNLRYIKLHDCENVKSLLTNTSDRKTNHVKFFSRLEEISLIDLGSLQLLWDRPHQYISFCNLTTIIILECHSLLELFPLTVAQGLIKLRDLVIKYCESLVVIISGRIFSDTEMMNNDDIKFPELCNIVLWGLPKLERFYSGDCMINYPCLNSLEVEGCYSMKRWSNGENHIPNIKFDEHQGKQSNINDYIEALF